MTFGIGWLSAGPASTQVSHVSANQRVDEPDCSQSTPMHQIYLERGEQSAECIQENATATGREALKKHAPLNGVPPKSRFTKPVNVA
jgi:hypothetical protein